MAMQANMKIREINLNISMQHFLLKPTDAVNREKKNHKCLSSYFLYEVLTNTLFRDFFYLLNDIETLMRIEKIYE